MGRDVISRTGRALPPLASVQRLYLTVVDRRSPYVPSTFFGLFRASQRRIAKLLRMCNVFIDTSLPCCRPPPHCRTLQVSPFGLTFVLSTLPISCRLGSHVCLSVNNAP